MKFCADLYGLIRRKNKVVNMKEKKEEEKEVIKIENRNKSKWCFERKECILRGN